MEISLFDLVEASFTFFNCSRIHVANISRSTELTLFITTHIYIMLLLYFCLKTPYIVPPHNPHVCRVFLVLPQELF